VIDKSAASAVRIVEHAHNSVTDMANFLEAVQNNLAVDARALLELPQRVANAKSKRDALIAASLSQTRVNKLMEVLFGYTDWGAEQALYDGIFTKLDALVSDIQANTGVFSVAFSGSPTARITIPANVQTVVNNRINAILADFS